MRRTLLLLIVLVAEPRPADACSCAPSVLAVSPTPNATDVPTNAIVIASYDSHVEVELREVATNAIVPLAVEHFGSGVTTGRWLFGRPTSPLAPTTEYELAVTVFDTTTTRFTTGTQTDTLPTTASLAQFRPEVMAYPTADGGCINTCIEADQRGLVTRMHVDGMAPDAALLTLDVLEADGVTVVERLALRERGPHTVGFSLCNLRAPSLAPDAMYCARLVAFDAAGNAATSDVVCSATATCASKADPELACTPTRTCEPVTEPDDPLAPVGEAKGCAATGGGPWWLGLLLLVRRRRLRR